MGSLGTAEVIIILVVLLALFGGKKFPVLLVRWEGLLMNSKQDYVMNPPQQKAPLQKLKNNFKIQESHSFL